MFTIKPLHQNAGPYVQQVDLIIILKLKRNNKIVFCFDHNFSDHCYIYNTKSSSNTVSEMITSSGIFSFKNQQFIQIDLLFVLTLLIYHDLKMPGLVFYDATRILKHFNQKNQICTLCPWKEITITDKISLQFLTFN